MELIKLKDSGIRKVAIQNDEGEVVSVLKINIADREVAEKYGRILDRLEKISEEAKSAAEEMKKKYEGTEVSFEQIRESTRTQVVFIKEIITEIDHLFGKNTVRNVFKENYEIDEYFIPSEEMLQDFLKQIMPIMEKFFKQKSSNSRRKYSAKRGNR